MTQQEAVKIGDLFKKRRNEMNLTLKEVETATSIRLNYLHSIEDNQLNRLISPVYAQGFVRQYAVFLGLDSDKIIRDYPDIFQRSAGQEFNYGIGTLEMRNSPAHAVKGVPNFVWGIILIGVLCGAWFFGRFFEVL